jgi:hypothetical protein
VAPGRGSCQACPDHVPPPDSVPVEGGRVGLGATGHMVVPDQDSTSTWGGGQVCAWQGTWWCVEMGRVRVAIGFPLSMNAQFQPS